jgi:hypothetical protein
VKHITFAVNVVLGMHVLVDNAASADGVDGMEVTRVAALAMKARRVERTCIFVLGGLVFSQYYTE